MAARFILARNSRTRYTIGAMMYFALGIPHGATGNYHLCMENEIGSIEKGKLADLVVLSDNLFEIDRDRIWKVKPAVVLMEGEVIQGSLPEEIQE